MRLVLQFVLGCVLVSYTPAADWPQFRGPGGLGLAVGTPTKLPAEIGPQSSHLLWKVPVAAGHSSPVVVGGSIFLTAVRNETLYTVALDRATGATRWEVAAPHAKLEQVHRIGNHAQSTCTADADVVVSFFGSAGLFCYDHAGQKLWQKPMGPFNNDFGAASSPVLSGDRVVLCQDHDTGSFLASYERRSGTAVWRVDRSEFPRNYCSPVIWQNGRKQVIVAATLRVVGYDFDTGEEAWTVRGISRTVCSTPVVGGDGRLYVAGWAAGGDEGEPIVVPPWEEAVRDDANKDNLLQEAELPTGPIKQRFLQVDRDKTGGVTRAEYDYFRGLFAAGKNMVLAIEPGGVGEATATHVRWRNTKSVPFCASPLFVNGLVFTVRDGGILSSLDADTGKAHKLARLSGTDDYYASPVADDGKVYLFNQEGKLTVVTAAARWEELHRADFGEEIYATPALVDGRIYVRTAGHLYCFGAK